MNKREAIAALRELADKLEAMPIDGEALRINVYFNAHDVTLEQLCLLKPLVKHGEPRSIGFGAYSFSNRDAFTLNEAIDVALFGPKEVICP